jgi:hypothetical protein
MSKLRITLRGWPWQRVDAHWASHIDKTAGERYGWNPFKVKGMGRFGGGWAFKLGVDVSLRDWVFYLGIGSIRVTLTKRPGA